MADLTPNNREEHWLQGMVDGQTTLEPNKRREYWYKEIVDAIGSGGGGGGTGGGVLKVNMTWSEDYSSCTLDKTYAEIFSAFQNSLVLSINNDTGTLSLWLAVEIGYINDQYSVNILPIGNIQSGSLPFVAETENSYPVFSE